MLRCANCGLCVQRLQRNAISSLPQHLSDILRRWLTVDVPEGVLCRECYILIQNENIQSPRRYGHQNICAGCGCSVNRIRNHNLLLNNPLLQNISWTRLIQNQRSNYQVCHTCWVTANRRNSHDAQRHSFSDDGEEQPHIPEPPQLPPVLLYSPTHSITTRNITLPNYKRIANTSRHCIFNHCMETPAHIIPSFMKTIMIKSHNLYIPRSARVCRQHLFGDDWDILHQQTGLLNSFSAVQIEDLIEYLKINTVPFNFENVEEMPDHICHYWTGRNVSEFLQLYNELELTTVKKPKTSLAAFLIKLRTGESNKRLASLFNIPRATLEFRMSKVKNCLLHQFVPQHIGTQHLSHQDIVRRNLAIPNALFGNEVNNHRPAIIICDGTYIFIQKSSNYFYQKATYSLHKYDNLVKPFLLVCTDGHIIDVVGPYAATQTDAEIMVSLFDDETGPMRTLFRANDVFILDRGFRDSIPLLEACRYQVKRPENLPAGETQLPTLQANKSRMVTLCRWVVEVVNGRFKRDFKIFREKYFNRAHKHLMSDFKIAAALLNRFHPVLTDRPDAQEIVDRALRNLHSLNLVAQFVITNNLNRRSTMFIRIEATVEQLQFFPRLTYSELMLISLGPYQVKQARSYYGEHMRINGSYILEICQDLLQTREMAEVLGGNLPTLIRGRIKSRHVSRKIYNTYILVDAQPSTTNSLNAILGYYCSCIVGKRTVGCCCHIMTIIWYLGWARYENNVTPPARFLDDVLVTLEE